jgi:YbbR domain-containing protein
MFKFLRENLILKIVSLLASLSLWLYVNAASSPVAPKTVNADVVSIGAPPSDLIVRIRQEPRPVQITGPSAEVDSVDDNEIKAEVDLRSARVGVTQLKITGYRKPDGTPNVVIKGSQFVSVDVFTKARRLMPVTALFNNPAGPSLKYGTPRVKPEWAYVSGAADDVKRVQRLVVSVESSGQSDSADLKIFAEDRDNVMIPGVDIEPKSAHVDIALEQPPATRTLVVNVLYRGKPAAGHTLSDVIVEPSTVTVVGKPEQIQALSNLVTEQVDIEGVSGEVVKQVMLSPPEGVGVAGGRPSVRVTFKTQEIAKPSGQGSP